MVCTGHTVLKNYLHFHCHTKLMPQIRWVLDNLSKILYLWLAPTSSVLKDTNVFKIVSDIPGPEFQLHRIHSEQNTTSKVLNIPIFRLVFICSSHVTRENKWNSSQIPHVNARPTLCSRSNFTDCISLLLNTSAQKWVLPCTEEAVCKAHETQRPQTQLPHAERYFQHSWQHLHLCWSESTSTFINWMHKNVNFLNRWHYIVFYSLIYQRIIQQTQLFFMMKTVPIVTIWYMFQPNTP